MKQKMTTIGLAGLLATSAISLTAFAGKEDREFKDKELMPAVKAAEAKFKSACGCALAITIDEATVKTRDDYAHVKYTADTVTEGAAGYCTDAASKKAVCQMKTLVLAKAAEATFTFKGGKGIATTDGQSNTTFEMMTQQLDK
jgi:hypothetical protein